jgi:hypothetical protein
MLTTLVTFGNNCVHSWGCSSQNFTSKNKLLKPEQARYRNNALTKFSKETVESIHIYHMQHRVGRVLSVSPVVGIGTPPPL